MFIKKEKGSVLIIVMFTMCIISMLSAFVIKIIQHNSQIEKLNIYNSDKFNLNDQEETILYEFMNKLNNKNNELELKNNITTSSSIILENDVTTTQSIKTDFTEKKSIFNADFKEIIEENTLTYKKEKDELKMCFYDEKLVYKERKLKHITKNKKIILIPTISIMGDE